jgi:hypothetical protein
LLSFFLPVLYYYYYYYLLLILFMKDIDRIFVLCHAQ